MDKETIDLIKKLAKDEKLASQMDYVRKMTDLVEMVAELAELVELVENVRRVKNKDQTDYAVPETNRYVSPPSIVPERFRSITEPLDYSLVREDLNSITTPRNYSLNLER